MHGLQSTWPHGMVSIALSVFERPFLQAGQINVGGSVEGELRCAVEKVMEIRDLRENG